MQGLKNKSMDDGCVLKWGNMTNQLGFKSR
jgi:hypothetical protein